IAIDDFGVGHSCLSYITNLPVNTLKIDRCFVNNISTDIASQKIVQAIISMATSLDLSVVVEGIETKKQEAVVKTLGAKFGQGFYFHKPVTSDEFIQIFVKPDKIKKISF
ncbi:MAG TPA: EAL domain-containing protein, partial [Gammaproteobacteria bacterium]|nr:EAL domain-containing protein [Gammaproteobacteria bacterium]